MKNVNVNNGYELGNGVLLINTTPHAVNLMHNGNVVEISKWDNPPLNIQSTQTSTGDICGIDVSTNVFEEFDINEFLPKEQKGIYYLVSLVVLEKSRHKRSDLLGINNSTVKRENGKVLYIVSFIK